MATTALYREFRPRRFSELKGQEAISDVLKNQVRTGKPSHAYLFAGPRGTGKTSSAKILAMALNCLSPKDGEPCLECEHCKEALNDAMPDIIEMDAASNNTVDSARDLRDKIILLPVKGKYKVYIIDEVHMLTNQAFNALLKTLEEPPAYAVFILATTELGKLPKTVLSRCQRFDFRYIGDNAIIERMKEVLRETGTEAEEEALATIAASAEGGMRDALSILGKCINVKGEVTAESVESVLGRADKALMTGLLDAMARYDEGALLTAADAIMDSGVEAGELAGEILGELRAMLISAVAKREDEAGVRGAKMGVPSIVRALELLSAAESAMKRSERPFIILETTLVRITMPESANAEANGTERLAKIERKLEELKAHPPIVVTAAPAETAAVSADTPAPPAEPVSVPVKRRRPPAPEGAKLWQAALVRAEKTCVAFVPMMEKLELVRVDGDLVVVTSATPAVLRLIEDGELKAAIEKVLSEVAEKPMRIATERIEQAGFLEELVQKGIEIVD